jgi:hypothetical protein
MGFGVNRGFIFIQLNHGEYTGILSCTRLCVTLCLSVSVVQNTCETATVNKNLQRTKKPHCIRPIRKIINSRYLCIAKRNIPAADNTLQVFALLQ